MIKLEVWTPPKARVLWRKEPEQYMDLPRIKKLRLTEESEIALFGNLGKYRDCRMPPLDFNYNSETVELFIDEEQVEIHNNKMTHKKIKPGKVTVTRSNTYDIIIENIKD